MRGQEQRNSSSHPLRERIVTTLQTAYNNHRSTLTAGTPSVSAEFFETWRTAPSFQGLAKATGYLIHREKALGNPNASPVLKAIANITASTLLVAGVEQWTENSQPNSKQTPLRRGVIVAQNLSHGMLVFAQGQGSREVTVTNNSGEKAKEGDKYWLQKYNKSIVEGQKIMEQAIKAYNKGKIEKGDKLMSKLDEHTKEMRFFQEQMLRESGKSDEEIQKIIKEEEDVIENIANKTFEESENEWKFNHPDDE